MLMAIERDAAQPRTATSSEPSCRFLWPLEPWPCDRDRPAARRGRAGRQVDVEVDGLRAGRRRRARACRERRDRLARVGAEVRGGVAAERDRADGARLEAQQR